MQWSKAKRSSGTEVPSPEAKHELPALENRLPNETDEDRYPPTKVVLPIIVSACLAVFLTALDRTIIGTAVPTISNDFKSFDDISWYESAYLLTFAALQLPMGKIYTFFPSKWAFITIVIIFEIGSIICAAAPTSTVFIVGRAIAGVGSAGTSTGALVIFADLLPLEKRPKYQGFLGATFGLASIAGPLLGGVFTTKATWRWCFWINAPIGGVVLAILLLLLPTRKAPQEYAGDNLLQRVQRFDPIGTALVLPGLTLLLLAVQWGGTKYAWGSAQVIVALVLGLVLLLAFAVSQIWVGENSVVPPRIIRQRSIAAGAIVSIGLGSTLVIASFYLPIWYQAVKGLSAVDSGVRMLGYFLMTVFCVIGSGVAVSKTGYYTPWLIIGNALLIVAFGLLSTFKVTTSTGESIGFQLITGAGIGFTLAQCNNAAQTVLSREDIPTGITILNFANFVGGTIFVSVCQGILSNSLVAQLRESIPGIDVSSISSSGVTNLSSLVSAEQLPILLAAYNNGIDNVFYCGLGLSCLAFVASWFVEWKTVKKQ